MDTVLMTDPTKESTPEELDRIMRETMISASVARIVVREKEALMVESAELRAERDELARKLEHSRYWYAVRLRRLEDFFRQPELKGTPVAHDFWCIIANGSLSNETPLYAQQFNRMKWKVEKAEAENAELRREAARLNAAVATLEHQLIRAEGRAAVRLAPDSEGLATEGLAGAEVKGE